MMRLGFLGCGYNRSHLELLKRRSDVEIAALFSRSLERAKETAATFGGRPYDDYGEMLDREELDAVYVGLPPYAHGDPELRCIDRKLPLFIEKPVALDVETAARIADRAEQSGVFLFPAYKYRYSPLVERLAAELKRESITLADGFYQIDVAPGKDWWRTRAMSGGQMVEQATHIVDLLRLFCGEIVERSLYTTTVRYRELDVPDSSAMLFRCQNGTVGCIRCSFAGTVSEAGLTIDTTSRRITLVTEWPALKLFVREAGKEPRLVEEEQEPVCRARESELFLQVVQGGSAGVLAHAYRDAIRTLQATL
jgi:myo-inositol 2-dehydrogenase/D-chiro-inositol 1-dehydrogenase